MKLLLQIPADTTVYMIAGYAFIFGTMLIYLASLILRRRALLSELLRLQGLHKHNG